MLIMNQMVQYGQNSDLLLKELPKHVTREQVEQLLNAVDTFYMQGKNTLHRRKIADRDKLLLNLMWVTGARVGDVVKFDLANVDMNKQQMRFYVDKRNIWHTLTIDNETLFELLRYKDMYKIEGQIFDINRHAVNALLKKYAGIAGIGHIHPHMFRHGIAIHMRSNGIPREVIAFRLAHSNTATTAAYYDRITPELENQFLNSMDFKFR